ncbi:hypothetical protein AX16_001835 [Volvariella volvacea WC 439]|nr:hypothetical protein AX16_001835 [Volvariella volvacea WC 439]
MPAVTTHAPADSATFGHVNLMVDTCIANATADDLRAIMRNMLATGPPGLATCFSNSARSQMLATSKTKPLPPTHHLFTKHGRYVTPLPQFYETLKRVRSLYGAGLGFASLSQLAMMIRMVTEFQWESEGIMMDALITLDADIGQAVQSSKEEIEGGRVSDLPAARAILGDIKSALTECRTRTTSWKGVYPFGRAQLSINFWKI